MKIIWVMGLYYDEDKQLYDKAVVQMGEDDDIHDIQADMAEQMADLYLSLMEETDDDSTDES